MFVKFKKGKQSNIIKKAIIKAGSERALSKITAIPKISIYKYKFEITNIPNDRLEKILKFLDIPRENLDRFILMELDHNWGRVKGGINCVNKKRKNGTLANEIEKLRQISSKRMRKWHKNMKKNSPREYYIWQYERFKKVGRGYMFNLDNEIPVRNLLEKKVGDFLIQEEFAFEYEPYINIKGKAYFPDFKIDTKIIEITAWTHPDNDKLFKLNKKIKDYKDKGFEVVLFIPNHVRKFYKETKGSIISTLPELKNFLNASVAQTCESMEQ